MAPAKGNHPAVHVLNPTGVPVYDEFGVDHIFQPDQSKTPGTFGFKLDGNGRRVRGADGKLVLERLPGAAGAKKANNIRVMPGAWFEAHYSDAATRKAKGLDVLVIVETKVDAIVRENERLNKEAISVAKDKAQLAELAAELAKLEGVAPAGTDIAKGIAGIKSQLAHLFTPASKK